MDIIKISQILNNQKGFTLVELLAVIVIIGTLASLALPRYENQAEKAREGTARAELKSMKTILDLYYVENGNFPDTDSIGEILEADGINWTGVDGGIIDPWDNPYKYAVTTESDGYMIYSEGNGDGAIIATDSTNPETGQDISEVDTSYGDPVSSA